MINIWIPCNCGGKPKETGREMTGEILCIRSTCGICGKKLRDCFEVKYLARFYDDELLCVGRRAQLKVVK